ncbi:MAG: methylmalonyl Co-A mutase-associated GTPase MeaB [Bacteroidales bacterium]|nr:methylmalonyl Co-A mutase-associated GTPase MeaB [Bacteroidales bacterium]
MKKKDTHSALKVQEGIEQPPNLNPNLNQLSRKKKILTLNDYIEGIKSGNRTILSKAITLIESTLPEHRTLARQIVEGCLPLSGNSIRIGITGIPGVGKSTFIESFGNIIIEKGYKLAVLAIDPSSERSGGSILGDKTRMEHLSTQPNAFIRPSPSGCNLGGVARRTRESIILCEAAGFNVIFIETVGVGQSETVVHSMVDVFLLLMLAGAGDELQGIKRGIMEMSDIIAITKADGINQRKCEVAAREYKNALQYLPLPESGWKPKVLTCSSLTGFGMNNIWETLEQYFAFVKNNQYFDIRRRSQAKYWMFETITDLLKEHFYNTPVIQQILPEMEQKVVKHQISSIAAAEEILNQYFNYLKK